MNSVEKEWISEETVRCIDIQLRAIVKKLSLLSEGVHGSR